MAKQKTFTYRVRGGWPFPLDMPRYDYSRAATPADQALIDKLSDENLPDDISIRDRFEIDLMFYASRPTSLQPNKRRWESFDWKVL